MAVFGTSRSTLNLSTTRQRAKAQGVFANRALRCVLFSLVVAIGGSVWCWEDTIFRK